MTEPHEADLFALTARGAALWGREIADMIASWEQFVDSDELRVISDKLDLPHEEVKKICRARIQEFQQGLSDAARARRQVLEE